MHLAYKDQTLPFKRGRYASWVSIMPLAVARHDAPRRMLKMAVQRGRSERRGEEVRTALRVTVRPCSASWRTDKPL